MKKIFSLIMVACLAFASAFVGVAIFVMPNGDDTSETGGEVGVSWSGSGTSSSPYLITSASDLQTLATNVNSGLDYGGTYFLQTADIDLSSISNWTPIGISSTYYFNGEYNGNDYSIKNMTITTTANYAGLFGYCSSRAMLENIIMENVSISGTYSYVGSVVGYITGGDVDTCYATGTIAGAGNIGGVAGYLYNGAGIYRCASAVTINATGSNVGGVVGGSNYTAYIEQCYNSGTVTSTGSNVGGIIGYCYRYGRIVNCYNVAPISGASYVGGIVGYYSYYGDSASSSYHIKFCYNTGALKTTSTSTAASTSYIGGIAGVAYDCYVYSNWAYCSITSGSGSYTNSGGIAGSNGSNVYDNYNYFNITNSTVTTDKGGTRDTSLATNAKNSSWTGYNSWSISTSGSSTWHLDSTGRVFPVVRETVWHSGEGTESSPFTISQGRELHKLAVLTNMGVNYDQLYFKQAGNIDISSYSSWTPIGKASYYFRGIYDGSGYSVSGLKISSSGSYAGLFGYVYYATIKNLTIASPTLSTSASYVGALGGQISYSSIDNVVVTNVNLTTTGSYAGGVVGYLYMASISNCSVSGTVSAAAYAGGVVGYASNSSATIKNITACLNMASVTVTSYYIGCGGVVGYVSGYYQINNCSNSGTITQTNDDSSGYGGIVGYLVGYSTSYYAKVQYCYNTGTINGIRGLGGIAGNQNYYTNIYDCYNVGRITSSSQQVGGIVGRMCGYTSSTYPSRIVRCYNAGALTGSYTGGIIGMAGSDSYYTSIKDCFNVGTITTLSYHGGGISGWNYSSTSNAVSNCYWWTGCGASYAHAFDSSSTGSTGISSVSTVKSSSWSGYSNWDFSSVWMISSSVNNGYPVFKYAFQVGSGGSGTSTDPFLISSLEDLQELQKKVNAGTNYQGVYFKQTANIDMKTIANWTPIGASSTTYFAGIYNGDGYTIANLTINNSSNYQGLFGYCSGISSAISNIRLLNVNVTAGSYVGALSAVAPATISNISISGTVSGSSYVGGLVGSVANSSIISECFNLANVTGNSAPSGGLVGQNSSALNIYDCYNRGNVTNLGTISGGIVGYSYNTMSIYRSYNTGAITASSSGYAGGLVGHAQGNNYANLYNCYNLGTVSGTNVGGLSGSYGTNSSCYYDSSCGATYGIRSSSSTTGKTSNLTSSAKSSSHAVYSSWDFSSNWLLIPTANDGLPVLKDFYWTGTGSGTESSPFVISSLANLQLLQSFVNKGEHYEGMYFKQTTSINMSSISNWTPIGDYATNDFLWFSGYYKQNNYSTYYLTISSSKNYRGLFGYAKNATFENLYFYGSSSYSISASGASYVGTLLGYGLNCKIEKYTSSAYPHVTGGQYTGAIAGYLGHGSVINNSYASYQKVTGTGHYVGGLVGGLNASTMTNCYRNSSSTSYEITNASYGYTGGLVGYSYNSTIDNCYAYTPVTGSMHVGGLVGILDCGTISNSYHTSGSVTAANYAGGIVGQVYNTGKITACYNTGAVNATTKGAGGLAGLVGGTAKTKFATVEKSYNSGAITGAATTGGLVGLLDDYADLLNCYNSGSVTATGAYTGGLVGKIEAFDYNNMDSNYPTNIKYCFNKGAVKGTTYVGGIVGYIALDNTHVTIAYSYNVGAVSSSSGATSIGGIAGYAPTSQTYSVMKFLTNYWDTDCGATYGVQNQTSVGGVTGYSALDTSTYALNSSWALYSYWDFTNTWRLLSSYNNGYPTFLWSLTKYTVYLNPNGGNESSYSITARYTEYITLPENTFTRAGFTANGWNKSSTLTSTPSYKAGDSYQVMGSTSFYANWTPIGMTLNLKVYIEHDLNGKNYELVTSAVSGLSVYFYYYNTTLSGSSTSNVQMKSTGAAVSGSARVNQSVTVYVTPPSGYICTDIVVNNESPTYSSKITSKSVSIGTGLSGYSSSNYTGEVRVYIKKSSGNNIEFE